MEHPPRPMLPRDQGGSIELTEGTGGIIAACDCGEFLELYKVDTTFRLRAPDSIDPDRTNPNAPFAAMVVERIGTSNPIISRVLLQGREILQSAFLPGSIDKAAVVRQLHEVKESLISCYKASSNVNTALEAIRDRMARGGVKRDPTGRTLPSVPQVPDLEQLCTQFLISAKRAIRGICALPRFFVDLDRADSNFDHLGKRLEAALGAKHPLTEFVTQNAHTVRYLIELRNGQEHPSPTCQTYIENISVLPDAQLTEPAWYVTGTNRAPIASDMVAGVDVLIELAEWVLIYLVDHSLEGALPWTFQELQNTDVDPKNPIRYRLTLDAARLSLPDLQPAEQQESTEREMDGESN